MDSQWREGNLSKSKNGESDYNYAPSPPTFFYLFRQNDPLKKFNLKSIVTKSNNMSEVMMNFSLKGDPVNLWTVGTRYVPTVKTVGMK